MENATLEKTTQKRNFNVKQDCLLVTDCCFGLEP